MGFSPCYGKSRQECVRRKYSEPRPHLLWHDENQHGAQIVSMRRNSGLLNEVLRSLVREHQFELHDFVIMPDHLHLLLTVADGMTIEKAMQLVKGRFSFRLAREYGYKGEVWQRGFSEVQVMNRQAFEAHRRYIANNPVKAGLVASGEDYPFCFRTLARKKTEQGGTGGVSRG